MGMNMNGVWLTSDHHFGHENIIKYCNRPFKTVEEMDDALITNWNLTIQPGDVIYCLGDFCFGDPTQYLNRLAGQKCLITGNHDWPRMHKCSGWAWVKNYYELKVGDSTIILNHYPLRSWNKAFHGSYHGFGHVHGRLPPLGRSRDVGVDCWNYKPVNAKEFIASLKDQPFGKEEDL